MSTRTNKGYLWVFDQQEKWANIRAEKIEQLEEIANTHLNWFEKHSTVSDLISWKRPVLSSKRIKRVQSTDASLDKTQSQSRELNSKESNSKESNGKESNLVLDIAIPTCQSDSTAKEAEHDTPMAVSTNLKPTTSTKTSQTIDQQSQVVSPERLSLSAIAENKDTDTKSNESVPSLSIIPPPRPSLVDTPQSNEQRTSNASELDVADVVDSDNQNSAFKSSIPLVQQDDDNEFEDEIQLVVSTRDYQTEVNQQQETMVVEREPSPMKSPSRSMMSGPTIVRHQSSFMSRLFKMGRPSISKNKEDSPSPTDMITTKRPSLDSVKSDSTVIPVVGSILNTIDQQPSQDIEVSQFMPTNGPRLKRKKLVVTSPVKTTTSDDNIPIETSTSSDTVNEDEPEEANAFKIPDWAKSPELRLHIQRQEGLDPDKIFGRVPPFQIREIFPPCKRYVGGIPKHAPE